MAVKGEGRKTEGKGKLYYFFSCFITFMICALCSSQLRYIEPSLARSLIAYIFGPQLSHNFLRFHYNSFVHVFKS